MGRRRRPTAGLRRGPVPDTVMTVQSAIMTNPNKWTSRLSRVTSGGNFIPEIDGLRFLAIGSVLLFHVSYALGRAYQWKLKPLEQAIFNLSGRGTLGVELFFAISGFILALPFARHYLEQARPVDIRRYYLRRLTRLEPPYIAALILFYAAALIMGDAELKGRYLSTFLVRLFYLHGLVFKDAPALNGVTWSLEIEVQFYLLVPLLVQIFRLPRPVRRGILALGMLLCPFLPLSQRMMYSVLSQLAFFLSGFLFADVFLQIRAEKRTGKSVCDWAALLIFAFVFAFPWPDPVGLRTPRHILPTLIFIFLCLMFQGRWLRRFFSWKPVYLIGGMCYSIYLIHYPFISTFSRVLARKAPGLPYLPAAALVTLLWLPVVLAISACFFVLIERPCMDHTWPQRLFAWAKSWFSPAAAPLTKPAARPMPEEAGRESKGD